MQSLPAPAAEVTGLGQEFFLIRVGEKKFACYCFEGRHGLALFSKRRAAVLFTEFLLESNCRVVETTLDEARGIAFERKMEGAGQIACLWLLDSIEHPVAVEI